MAFPPAQPASARALSSVPLPSTSVVLICSISQLWPFSLYEPKMVNMVLFSPGSVSRPYTNTGFSEKVNVFHVSPSFVLYLKKKDWESCQGQVLPTAGDSLLAPAQAPEAIPLPCHLLELVGLGALRDGHKNATVVAPGVIVGSRQCLEEKRCQGVNQSHAELREKSGWKARFVRNAA